MFFAVRQELEGPYYQPFDPPRKQPWGVDQWYELRRSEREQTEVCRMRYIAESPRAARRFRRAHQDGGDGARAVGGGNQPSRRRRDRRRHRRRRDRSRAYLLEGGEATYRRAGNVIRFGPGFAETKYTQVRGALPRLPGTQRLSHRLYAD